MIRRPPRSTPKPSSAASDVYKRQPKIPLLTAQLRSCKLKVAASFMESIHPIVCFHFFTLLAQYSRLIRRVPVFSSTECRSLSSVILVFWRAFGRDASRNLLFILLAAHSHWETRLQYHMPNEQRISAPAPPPPRFHLSRFYINTEEWRMFSNCSVSSLS